MASGKILIVDDEQEIRLTLRMIIRKMGYEVSTAENGAVALEMLLAAESAAQPFELMLCDLQMPELSGEELIRRMNLRGINTPVLVITGVSDKESVVNLMRLGCRDFIDKPFTPEELKTRVNEVLTAIAVENRKKDRDRFHSRFGEVSRASIHDINNTIGATLGFSEIILDELSDDHPMRMYLLKIHNAVNRTTEICGDILSVKPESKYSWKIKTHLNILIEKVARILEDISPPEITIATDNQSPSVWYTADAWQIQHALLNLGFNAIEAMPDGGAINFSIERIMVDNIKEVLISVSDTGKGIPEEAVECIFDTGFSSRGGSHGIGLSNVRTIIKGHGGNITVSSKINKGTTFTIHLPADAGEC